MDTSDLAKLAAMPDPGEIPTVTLAATDPERYRAAQQHAEVVRWQKHARILAAAGVRPGPSHHLLGDDPYPIRNGAFRDAEDLAREEAEAGRTYPGAPLVLFGYEPDDINHLDLWDLPDGYDWVAVQHQTAGLACRQRYLIGVVLEPRPDRFLAVDAFGSFAHNNGTECVGVFGVTLSELAAYAQLCQDHQVTAEWVYGRLEEGCSPLDWECATVLSDTPIPSSDELYPVPEDATWLERAKAARPFGESPWGVWVLGENCD